MNALNINDERVSISKDGFTIVADGLKFNYTVPALSLLPFVRTRQSDELGKYSDTSKFSIQDHINMDEKRTRYNDEIIPLFDKERKKENFEKDYLYSTPKKSRFGIDTFEDVNMGQLVGILGKLGNAHLILDGQRTPNVRINCDYNPSIDTLTAVSIVPASGHLLNDFMAQPRRLALAQKVCDKVVEDLDIASAYQEFSGVREISQDLASQTMLRYLNR